MAFFVLSGFASRSMTFLELGLVVWLFILLALIIDGVSRAILGID
jgi:hypothetical protein